MPSIPWPRRRGPCAWLVRPLPPASQRRAGIASRAPCSPARSTRGPGRLSKPAKRRKSCSSRWTPVAIAKAVLRRASHLRAIAATLGSALHLEPTSSILAAAPLLRLSGIRFRPARRPCPRRHPVPRRRHGGTTSGQDPRRPKHQPLRRHPAGARRAGPGHEREASRWTCHPPSLLGRALAGGGGPRVSQALRRARALLLPKLRDRSSGHRPRRDRAGKRGQAPARHRDPHRKRGGRRRCPPAPPALSGCAEQALQRAFCPRFPSAATR